MTNMGVSLKLLAASVVVPYLFGLLLSSQVISDDHFHRFLKSDADIPVLDEVIVTNEECDSRLEALMDKDAFEGVSILVHRNGEAEICGEASVDWDALRKAIHTFEYCPDQFDKFDVESLLTRLLARHVSNCGSGLEGHTAGFWGHCDRGEDRTPILLDHDDLVLVPPEQSLPCRFHTREGVRITSLKQLSKLLEDTAGACNSNETCSATPGLHLYAVPGGRVFMHAPSYVGEIFELPHVKGPLGLPVSLEVISVSPRVFDVHNFFTKDESADLVKRALEEKSESHRIKRSTTGAVGKSVSSQRTSENGFDTNGKTAVRVKKRCLEILGYDEYIESHGDGLQLLRYNLTTAYIPHMDWIDDPSGKLKHNYDSAHKGGNRYATILLYMSDLDEDAGGETVFTKGWPVGQAEEDHVPYKQALRELRESGDASMVLDEGSWEEEMVAKCRSRLSVRPNSARAVLFYSQLPTGEPDPASLHGGCPVLKGEKWAANLWVWNTPRDGFPGQPINPNYVSNDDDDSPTPEFTQIHATFKNTGNDPMYDKAELFYNEDTYWGPLGKDDAPLSVNTYETHKWNLKVDGKIVKTWQILNKDGTQQTFSV
jgi:hypothetical protein